MACGWINGMGLLVDTIGHILLYRLLDEFKGCPATIDELQCPATHSVRMGYGGPFEVPTFVQQQFILGLGRENQKHICNLC